MPLPTVAHLSNDDLVARLRALATRSHLVTAHLLVHLAEVEVRGLHLEAACESMFGYTTRVLGFDEGAAFKRVHAARVGRRFPRVLELLAEGRLHLAAIGLLAPRLTEQNQRELLDAAAGKSKRDIERLLATRDPRPDVAAQLRKLPAPRTVQAQPSPTAQAGLDFSAPKPPSAAPCAPKPPAPQITSEPLSAERFLVKVTLDAKVVDLLEQARALLGHREPGCNLARALEVAVERLHADLLKERFGVGARPRAAKPSTGTRHVPRAVSREVLARDGLACAYVDPATGRRCGSRDRLELQHHQPFARQGAHEPQNLSVYCRAHNAFAARRDYGPEHIDAKIRERTHTRSPN